MGKLESKRNILMAKKCVDTIFEANEKKVGKYNIIPLLRGHTGIGKTEIFQQLSQERNMGYVAVHLSQMGDVGDLMGLIEIMQDPKTNTKYTSFIPPKFLPRDGKWIFLLDELNQARPDVRAAIFEFLLSGKLGDYQMPQGCLIACAENPDTTDYQTVMFDNAAANARMCILQVDPCVNTWSKFAMKNDQRFSQSLVSFMVDNTEFFKYSKFDEFSTDDDATLTFRSIEMISEVERLNPDEEVFHNILAGFGGQLFASRYIQERKDKRYNISIHQVISNFEEVEDVVKELKEQNKSALQGKLIQELYDYLEDTGKDFSKKECNNILAFLINIDKDITFKFLRDIHRSEKYILEGKDFKKNVIEHSKLAEMINSVKGLNE